MPDFDSNHFNSLHVFVFASAPCSEPIPPANGVVKLEVNPYGGQLYEVRTTALFACDDGYKLDGSPIVECQLYGTWSPVTPTCKKTGNFHFLLWHKWYIFHSGSSL